MEAKVKLEKSQNTNLNYEDEKLIKGKVNRKLQLNIEKKKQKFLHEKPKKPTFHRFQNDIDEPKDFDLYGMYHPKLFE